jgi:beta-glucuronidase
MKLLVRPSLLVLLCVVLALSLQGWSQTNPLLTNINARARIDLDGSWKAIVDPYRIGSNARFFLDAKPKDKQELVEYDFDAAESLHVPGDWNSQREKLFFYEGSIWYRKVFNCQGRAHTRAFLYFGAANYEANVYLNGKSLGDHHGGFTPFDFEATGVLREGLNSIVVEVNSTRHPDGVPGLSTDWWNYGGLTRDVAVVEVPEVFVEDYVVQLAKGSTGEISGWAKVNGGAPSQPVTVAIPELSLKQSAQIDTRGIAQFRFPAKPQLWSPENPKLYKVVISSGNDTVTDEIGFRTIEVKGTQILLNGKPIFLRGISLHEEAPRDAGRAFSVEDDQILLGWAKELGCNFVRLAHYPHNENMVRLADKLGLLVWSEIPVYWGLDWKNPATLQNARTQLKEMITRDHNRAAVIFWSVGNETPNEPGRLEFHKQLVDDARQLDSTRLITAAMNRTQKNGPSSTVLNDPLGEYLDVLGWNEYLGWYGGKPEDAAHAEWKTNYDKPLIISEFGGGAPYGRHGDADARWTEEYQASIYENQIQSLRRIPSLAGMSPWVLMDFHSPRRALSGVQDYRNRKGLFSDRGERKKAFFVLQKFYQEQAKH